MAKFLLKSVTISDKASNHHGKVCDVLIKNGVVTDIGKVSADDAREINAKGMYLTRGWCDMRMHMADPGLEHKEDMDTAREAAARGGFTHIAALPNNKPVTQSKNDIAYLTSQNNTSLVQVLPIAAITLGAKGEELTEMIDLAAAGAVAFSDGIEPTWHSDILLKALQYTQKFNGLVIDRPEDKHLNMFGVMNEGINSTHLGMKGMPELAEDLVVQRNLTILEYAGGRLHMDCISTGKSLDMIKAARKKGLAVTCSMASYQPLMSDDLLDTFDSNYKVNPPLRSGATNKQLLKHLKDGVVDVIVSNHMPHDEESKKLEYDLADFGIINLQTVAADIATLAQQMDIHDLLDKVSNTPRELLGIDDQPIAKDSPADLTLYDPQREWEYTPAVNASKAVNSPRLGNKLKGQAVAVFNNKKSSFYI